MEWDLTDPIVIESPEDVKSEARWKERVQPFNHQVANLITFCRRLPVTLLADDVGLGKTISAGLIMSELIARSRLTKTLIVAPKLLGPQWQEELQSKFNIPAVVAVGKELLNADLDQVGAVITTYHSAREYIERLPADRFEMLILDEAHKLRNLYGTEKAPQVAVRFRRALEQRRFRFVLMLTATPIQNRLWDLYSLVDLLTVARGHSNPFGAEGIFARKFIADDREQARQLKPEAAEEFRSIVYGYMSRVRRGDAKLHFPDREVQLHKVDPTAEEMELIGIVAKGIDKLNRLAQIGILQALTSSPQALSAQLNNMERNRTIPPDLAADVRGVVRRMTTSAKLNGLGVLIEQLKHENPERWRLVIFTGRRETQTTIQSFLEGHGLTVGTINGSSGARNQETIAQFRATPPKCRVIVSTEAGSEGVNLQVANVLVNFDLPWNPMIVEQRIGRVQRLASEHAKVGIFNMTLRGTFEEYIVGRLMEKLQMSTSAIGDIEALLESVGVGGDDESGGFEEKIRQLVVAALKGADVQAAVRKAEHSIAEAKATLEREEQQINEMIGSSEGQGYVGPRAPSLPTVEHSIEPRQFTLDAFENLGARVSQRRPNVYLVEEGGGRELIRFSPEPNEGERSTVYVPGSPHFAKLVQRVTTSGVHAVRDFNRETLTGAQDATLAWVGSFDGKLLASHCKGARRWFSGNILMRARAIVAHDSYERLIEVKCSPRDDGTKSFHRDALAPLPPIFENLQQTLGLADEPLMEAVEQDPAIAEFSRFYIERRAQEITAAAGDERKRKKMEDDFTPRVSVSLVGADGGVLRDAQMEVSYEIGGKAYKSEITVVPSSGKIVAGPNLETCSITKRDVPTDCLTACAATGAKALDHLMIASDFSNRKALPDQIVKCELSGRNALTDEVAVSAVTGLKVAKQLMSASPLSGTIAENSHFGQCQFTGQSVLLSELRQSEISGRRFRMDEAVQSCVSAKTGHRSEFIACHETRQQLAPSEAERCDATGHQVRPGILLSCEKTGVRVLPSELGSSAISNRRVVKRLLVSSSVSGASMLEEEAVRSSLGKLCAPVEAGHCEWSGTATHPEDMRKCGLTGLSINSLYCSSSSTPRLSALEKLLDGVLHEREAVDLWASISTQMAALLGKGKVVIEASALSPDRGRIALVAEHRTMLGFKSRHVGLVADLAKSQIVGRIAQGKRDKAAWNSET